MIQVNDDDLDSNTKEFTNAMKYTNFKSLPDFVYTGQLLVRKITYGDINKTKYK